MKGRLPSKVLGLHLEADGNLLRLYQPATKRRLLIPPEVREALEKRRGGVSEGEARSEGDRGRHHAAIRREREVLCLETEELRRQTEELRRQTQELRRRPPRS